MGPWPPLIENPRVDVVNTTRRENITQQQVRIEIALGSEMVDALLLVPDDGDAPARKHPAVLLAEMAVRNLIFHSIDVMSGGLECRAHLKRIL